VKRRDSRMYPERNGPRKNFGIRVPEVRLIDSAGRSVGIVSTGEARKRAQEVELDLVEINPKSFPPVCKIMDYGKHLYDQKKAASEAKARRTVVVVKELKLRPKTDSHDLEVRVAHARRFLEAGDKVKVICRFRGREITHPEVARKQLNYIADQVADLGGVESPPAFEGRALVMTLSTKALKR
jgi:translation initiation factor IF-3